MKNKLVQYVGQIIKDNQGHDLEHVYRVLDLAMTFAGAEKADKQIVELAVFLHDVDDYKFVGIEQARKLYHASSILDKLEIEANIKAKVLDIIANMGYSKYLEGIRPTSIEGMVVSDADMCDAIGATGILRAYEYGSSKGLPFFDKNIIPVPLKELSVAKYKKNLNHHTVQHFFDKLLLIPNLMQTKSGKAESRCRQKIMIDFLKHLFIEEKAENWLGYLEEFLRKHYAN